MCEKSNTPRRGTGRISEVELPLSVTIWHHRIKNEKNTNGVT